MSDQMAPATDETERVQGMTGSTQEDCEHTTPSLVGTVKMYEARGRGTITYMAELYVICSTCDLYFTFPGLLPANKEGVTYAGTYTGPVSRLVAEGYRMRFPVVPGEKKSSGEG
jgi:hypothetical protein